MRYIAALLALPLVLAAPVSEDANLKKYIVVLKSTAAVPTQPSPGALSNKTPGATLANVAKDHIYDMGNFKGFASKLTEAQVDALRLDPNVAYIERDAQAHIYDTKKVAKPGVFVTQTNVPTWGLGRLSSRDKGVQDYVYHSTAGAGTCSYIVDTGVDASHPEFEGRAELIKNLANSATTDDNGHGTHVSGTIGSVTHGVAKKTKLYGVKVLDQDGYGDWSTVIAGVAYAVNHSTTADCPNGAVINMSLGGSRSQAVNDAAAAAYDAGVFIAVAAGNDGMNCDAFSPASEPKAFSVGAIDTNDNITSYSNYGFLVNGFAPGDNINSTWPGNKYQVDSGTSMATPHIVGLAAYFLGYYGQLDPEELKLTIQAFSTRDIVKNIFPNTGTHNFLAFNGYEA